MIIWVGRRAPCLRIKTGQMARAHLSTLEKGLDVEQIKTIWCLKLLQHGKLDKCFVCKIDQFTARRPTFSSLTVLIELFLHLCY